MFAAATTAILVIMMVMLVAVIVGMIMSVIVVTAMRVVVAATGLVARIRLVAAALPAGEDHEEKSGREHENENNERVHSDSVTYRTLGRVRDIVERATKKGAVAVTERGRPPPQRFATATRWESFHAPSLRPALRARDRSRSDRLLVFRRDRVRCLCHR